MDLYFTHGIHVWYIYLHENHKFRPNVGKYTSPMDGMGFTVLQSVWSRAGMQASFLRGLYVAEVNQEG